MSTGLQAGKDKVMSDHDYALHMFDIKYMIMRTIALQVMYGLGQQQWSQNLIDWIYKRQ